jgi:hypothetical protein
VQPVTEVIPAGDVQTHWSKSRLFVEVAGAVFQTAVQLGRSLDLVTSTVALLEEIVLCSRDRGASLESQWPTLETCGAIEQVTAIVFSLNLALSNPSSGLRTEKC